MGRMLFDAARDFADLPAHRLREGDGWRTWTYAEVGDRVGAFARWLIEQGVQPGDRVALLSGNRPEWQVADFAIMAVGALTVPLYASSSADQVAHIIADSGAQLAVVRGRHEAALVAGAGVTKIVTLDPVPDHDQLDACGPARPDSVAGLDARLAATQLGDLATVIYTSGTTGQPRGVMLAHRAFAYQIDAINGLYDVGPGDSSVCFLPLAHALERIWSLYVTSRGALNTYCTDPRRIAELLPLAKPNLLISVPRLYEKVYATAHQRVAESPAKKAVLRWALHVGGQLQRAYRKGKQPSPLPTSQLPIADRLVLRSIRDAIGGPKKVLISGGAPLRLEIEEFFSACGVLLGQGYGLTETGPMMTYFSPTTYKLGTVGYCTPGGEIRIADGGEICYRGPNLMRGYWNDPGATDAAIDADGWFHTGDVGYLDAQGYLVITDRLKDIIVTSGGKNVAPQAIEGLILTDSLFEYAVVLGNDRPYLTMFVQPTRDGLEALAEQLQVRWKDAEELVADNVVVDEVKQRIDALTSRLPGHAQIRDVRVMLDTFTQDNDLLTPTLKVKRREVERRFAELIDEMSARAPRWASSHRR